MRPQTEHEIDRIIEEWHNMPDDLYILNACLSKAT